MGWDGMDGGLVDSRERAGRRQFGMLTILRVILQIREIEFRRRLMKYRVLGIRDVCRGEFDAMLFSSSF